MWKLQRIGLKIDKTEILWLYKETEVILFGSRIKSKCDKST